MPRAEVTQAPPLRCRWFTGRTQAREAVGSWPSPGNPRSTAQSLVLELPRLLSPQVQRVDGDSWSDVYKPRAPGGPPRCPGLHPEPGGRPQPLDLPAEPGEKTHCPSRGGDSRGKAASPSPTSEWLPAGLRAGPGPALRGGSRPDRRGVAGEVGGPPPHLTPA